MQYTKIPDRLPGSKLAGVLIDAAPAEVALPYIEAALTHTELGRLSIGPSNVHTIENDAYELSFLIVTDARPGELGRAAEEMAKRSSHNVLLGPALPLNKARIMYPVPGDLIIPADAWDSELKDTDDQDILIELMQKSEDLRRVARSYAERFVDDYWGGGIVDTDTAGDFQDSAWHAAQDSGLTADFFRLSREIEVPGVALLTITDRIEDYYQLSADGNLSPAGLLLRATALEVLQNGLNQAKQERYNMH